MRGRTWRARLQCLALAATLAGGAAAQTPPAENPTSGELAAEVARLREELDVLRRDYSERLRGLEERLAAVSQQAQPQAGVAQPEPAAQPQPAAPQPAAQPVGPPEPALPPPPAPYSPPAASGPAPSSSKVFNPDIAVVGDFLGAVGTNESESAPPSFEMHEAEASFQAAVDPYARADFFFAFSPEGVEIEEGFITFPTLPGGFLMKAGKLRASFGKVNVSHIHSLAWTDRPLVTENLVGGEEGISDAGVSLSRLFPNRFVFLEATGEVYRGQSELYAAARRQDVAWLGRLRAYRDLTESTNLDLGGSLSYGKNGVTDTSSTQLWGADATLRWRPLRRALYRRLLARTELVWSRREQEGGRQDGFGFYASGEYQFARRWFAGLRYDLSDRADDASLRDTGQSLLLTFWPSEFSQIRAQYRRTKFADGPTANELLFQFLFSIGAHGAHVF